MYHESIYFRYKSPENYFHYIILMISNLRHIKFIEQGSSEIWGWAVFKPNK